MASFALFPSMASVFTLKSTPDQWWEKERLKEMTSYTWSASRDVCLCVCTRMFMYLWVKPMVADCSGSKVSSVNLRRRLLEEIKITWKWAGRWAFVSRLKALSTFASVSYRKSSGSKHSSDVDHDWGWEISYSKTKTAVKSWTACVSLALLSHLHVYLSTANVWLN